MIVAASFPESGRLASLEVEESSASWDYCWPALLLVSIVACCTRESSHVTESTYLLASPGMDCYDNPHLTH